jgi:hypothetical protein
MVYRISLLTTNKGRLYSYIFRFFHANLYSHDFLLQMENSGDESHPATPHGKNDSAEGLDLQNHGVVLCNKQDANSSSQVPDLKPYTAIL